MTNAEMPGPIDFVLLEFPGETIDDKVAAATLDLVQRGIVRLYDILVVRKLHDGGFESLELSALPAESVGGLATLAGARSGLVDDEDVAEMAGVLEPGTTGLLLVFENAWAIPFVTAAYEAGGSMIASQRIPAQDIIDALDSLDRA
jgi:hypothetical protein